MKDHIVIILLALAAGGILWWLFVPPKEKKETHYTHKNDHHEDHSKSGWLEIAICFALGLGMTALVMKGLYPLAIVVTCITLGYFCWGKEIPLAGKVIWALSIFIGVMLFINWNQKEKEGIQTRVDKEMASGYDEAAFTRTYQKPIQWWWRLKVSPTQPKKWSCPNILCKRWVEDEIVLEVPCGSLPGEKPYLRLEWDNLRRRGRSVYVAEKGETEGVLKMNNDIPSHMASADTLIIMSGEVELPLRSLNGPKGVFRFEIQPQTTFRKLLKSAVAGADKL